MATSWVDDMLHRVARIEAVSDLVFDPADDGSLLVRARVEGVYRDLEVGPATAIGRLKALAGVPAYITQEPQDGRIDGQPFGFAGDLRAAFLPTVRGPRAALRLPAIGAVPAPDALGLLPQVVAELRTMIRQPQGVVLICGPTGSGKTTTMHSLLLELVCERPDRLPVAIEDPVERRLDRVVQVEVRPHLDFGFVPALRASLRQDPDLILIGEIRDPETAGAALRAALSGHLVISSLHCARAVEALPRLIEMGVDPGLVVPVLSAVLAQRLVRVRHQACAGSGCAACQGGYRGRRVVADWLMPDHRARLDWVQGMAPPLRSDMDQQALALMQQGVTDAAEVERSLGRDLPGVRP